MPTEAENNERQPEESRPRRANVNPDTESMATALAVNDFELAPVQTERTAALAEAERVAVHGQAPN